MEKKGTNKLGVSYLKGEREGEISGTEAPEEWKIYDGMLLTQSFKPALCLVARTDSLGT